MHWRDLRDFWNRFSQNISALFGLAIVILLILVVLFSAQLSPFAPGMTNFDAIFQKPSWHHLFGTDNFGRDVLSRVIWGTRAPLAVGFVAASLSAIFGIILGAVAGFLGGRIDNFLMRIVDIFLTLPVFFLVLISVAFIGRDFLLTASIIGFTFWPSTARLVRAQFLSLKSQEFVEAARCAGCSTLWLIFVEILPNAIYPAIVNGSLQFASAILMEAGLSFLGLGDPNVVSWGWMIHDALRSYRSAWWLALFPGLAISLTVIAFNLIGDGLNDALNPKLKRRF